MAFIRGDMQRGDERVDDRDDRRQHAAHAIGSAKAPDVLQPEALSWSPDGKTILATASLDASHRRLPSIAIDVGTGDMRTIGEPWGFARDVQWLPDGRSFLAAGFDFSGMAAPQMWQVSYPSGARTRVTNDLNTYIGDEHLGRRPDRGDGPDRDRRALYVLQGRARSRAVSPAGPDRADGAQGIAWMPDGRVVYTSTATGLPQLWIVDGDGSNDRAVDSCRSAGAFAPSASPDGHWVYFSSYAKEGICLFRVAPDGSGFEQLTKSGDARRPIVSPDGATRVLHDERQPAAPDEDRRRRRHAAAGVGEVFPRRRHLCRRAPVRRHHVGRQAAPNGARRLHAGWRHAADAAGSADDRAFQPNGQLLTLDRVDGESVLVERSLAGGGKKQVTPAFADALFGGAVSRDGRIVISRGQSTSDVVLIRAK